MRAVITGDIVNSTRLDASAYELAITRLTEIFGLLESRYHAKWEIFRGDSFQLNLPEPSFAMHSALLIKTYLLFTSENENFLSVTLSVGLGEVIVDSQQLTTSHGSAYTLSGRGLDKTSRGGISLHSDLDDLNNMLTLPTHFLAHLLSSFSRKQAEALYSYILMNYPEHQKIADKMHTSRQNVSKLLSRGGAELVREYLLFYQTQVK